MAIDEFDVNADDDDFDLDFDSLTELPDSDVPSNRKPVERLAGGFIEGVKSSAQSDTFRRRLIENALPEGYAKIHKDLEEGVSLGKDLYDTAAKELQPVGREMKKVGRYLANKTDKILPKSISDKLKQWTEIESSIPQADSKEIMRDAEISASLKEVFGEQMKNDAVNRVADTVAEEGRHRNQLEYLDLIRSGIDRQISYQDTITANYQRKSLSLKYRQLYLAQDQFDLLRKYVVKTNEQLDSIVHNSALPDFVKTRMSEHAQEILRDKLIGRMNESVQKHTAGFVRNVKNKAIGKTKELFGKVAEGIRDTSDQLEMVEDIPIDGVETAGGMVGTVAGDELSLRIGKLLGSKLRGNETLERIGANLEYISDNKEEFLREMFEKEIDRDNREGFMGLIDIARTSLAESMRDALPSYSGVGRFDQNMSKIAEETAPYTALTDKSIVEIIPGLLSRQLQELEMIRTGQLNVERIEYNFERAAFTRESQAKADVMERVMPTLARDSINSSVDSFIDVINKDKELSAAAVKALKKQAVYDAADGRAFSPDRYGKYHELTQVKDDETRMEIADYFSKRYLDDEGEFRKDDYELSKERAVAGRKFADVRRNMPEYKAETKRLINIYGTSRMEDAGLIQTDFFGGTSSDLGSVLGAIDEEQTPERKPDLSPTSRTNALRGINPVLPTDQPISKEASSELPSIGQSFNSQYMVDNTNTLREQINASSIRGDTTNDWLSKIYGKLDKWDTTPPGGFMGGYGPGGHPSGGTEGPKGPSGGFIHKLKASAMDKLNAVTGVGKSKFDDIQSALGDLYVKGMDYPAIQQAKMSAGMYRDQLTGEVITSFDKIKGNVIDTNGNVVLLFDDVKKGLIEFGNQRKPGMESKVSKLLGSIISTGGSLAGGVLGMYGAGFKMAGKAAVGIKDFAMDTLMGDKVKDIYLKGKDKAVLLARDLEAGLYRDQITGDIIKTVEDIKGPVVDKLGNVVISLDDIVNKRLTFNTGKAFIVKLGSMAGKAARIGTSLLGSYYGALYNIGMSGYSMLKDKLSAPRDIYVKGEDKPRLYARLFEAGEYISQKTGKVISSMSDIDGPVLDSTGNVILTPKDFKTGLVDSLGKKITLTKGLLSNVIGKALTGAKRVIGGAMALGGKVIGGVSDLLFGEGLPGGGKSMFDFFGSGRKEEVDILTEIRDILDARLSPRLSIAGDMDGDGIREGSWQERLAEGRRGKELPAPGGTPIKSEDKSPKKKAASLLGLLFGEDEDDEEDSNEYSLDADFGDGDDKSRKSRKKRKSRKSGGGKKGLMRRAAGGAWDMAKKGGGFLKRAAAGTIGRMAGTAALTSALPSLAGAGTTLASTAMTVVPAAASLAGGALATAGGWLASAAAAVGGVLSAPVLLGAAVLGGAAYLAYKYLYKTPEGPIHRVRLTQYGINPDEKSHLGKIGTLEEMLKDHIKYDTDGSASLDDKVSTKEIIEVFDIAEGDNQRLSNWMKWFQGRFKPIYLSHMSVAKQMAPSAELLDMDDELDPSQSIVYINRVKFPHDSSSPYSVYNSPFEDLDELPMGSKEVQAAMDEAIAEFKEDGGKAVAPNVKTDASVVSEKTSQQSILEAGKQLSTEVKADSINGVIPVPSPGSVTNRTLSIDGITIATSMSDSSPVVVTPYTGDVDDFTAIRLLTYGVASLDPEKVAALLALEASVKYDTTVSNRAASFKGDHEVYFKRFAIAFALDQNNETLKMAWKTWFSTRFIPVYLNYVSNIAKLKRTVATENASKELSTEEKVRVALEVHLSAVRGPGTSLVWSVTTSPWEEYRVNTSIESIFPYLRRLESGGKKSAQKNRASSMVGVQPKPMPEQVTQQPKPDQTTSPGSNAMVPVSTTGKSNVSISSVGGNDGDVIANKSPDDYLDADYVKQKRMSDAVAIQQGRMVESSDKQLSDIQSVLLRSLAVQTNMAKSLSDIGHYYRLRWQKDEMEALEVEEAVSQGNDGGGMFNFFSGSNNTQSKTQPRTRRASSKPTANMKA